MPDYTKYLAGDGRIFAKIDGKDLAITAKVYGKFPAGGDRKPTDFALTLNGKRIASDDLAITGGSKEYGGYTYFRFDGKVYFVAGVLPSGVNGKFEPGTNVAGVAGVAANGKSFADLYAPVVPLAQSAPKKTEAPKAEPAKAEPAKPARKRSRR